MLSRGHQATGVAMVVFAFVWIHGTASVMGGTQRTWHLAGGVEDGRWSQEKRLFFEGFEGAFPPAGWVLSSTSPTSTWAKYGGVLAFEGFNVARVPTGTSQNEALSFFWDVATGSPEQLSFATCGAIDIVSCAAAQFSVEINGQQVFDFCRDQTAGDFVWGEYVIDLSAYAGQRIEILFRYAGSGGAYHYLDAVQIGALVPLPSACDGAAPLSLGSGALLGNTCQAANHISELACGPVEATGRDVWYQIDLPPGWTFAATVDISDCMEYLWLLDACDGFTDSNCLGGNTTYGYGPTTISHRNISPVMQRIYFVIDAVWNYSCGDYSGTYNCSYQTGVPEAAPTTWGRIKRSYQ